MSDQYPGGDHAGGGARLPGRGVGCGRPHVRRGRVALQVRERTGEILQDPSSRPRFVGLARGEGNGVLTDTIPLEWDHGRQVAGGSTVYEGYVAWVSCCT